uniref:ATP synthase F0 subunit 8 n=1 Tax=Protobothrops flavoviridis TaxID=88087 RepID=A0A169SLS7_PROFL|nr:ATP synthase F0 subunit 8 [Protobothrops flavoviridis]BAU97749.1 ATP synthase F0 subunit 8 [Protobothrops flavoviridis]BAU97762.1 ATP synthase F0 subunit 8 [Protobothrops flavoviridis]BAU97775.1 ATP synthase F0 subunit 8 [Protobothrops flavoviridis]
MPQLDIVHIFMVYLWTWLTLTLISLKIKTFTLVTKPKKQTTLNPKSTTLPTPWT